MSNQMIDADQLYLDLLRLASDDSNGFFWKDHEFPNGILRIFGYRLVRHNEWTEPGAVYSRGTTYWISSAQKPRLLSLCMPKFFNLGEPVGGGLEVSWNDVQKFKHVMDKLDGSLITTFVVPEDLLEAEPGLRSVCIPGTQIAIKSKGSFYSDVVVQARDWISKNPQWITNVMFLSQGVSRNFEWCAPENRIVIEYAEAELHPLNWVIHDTAEVIPDNHVANAVVPPNEYELAKFIEESTGIEGVVAITNDGRWCKIKTQWYAERHRLIDNFQSNKHLVESVWNEAIDDLMSMFPAEEKKLVNVEAYALISFGALKHLVNKVCASLEVTDDDQTKKERVQRVKDFISANHGIQPDVSNWLFSMLMAKMNRSQNRKERLVERLQEIIAEHANEFDFTESVNQDTISQYFGVRDIKIRLPKAVEYVEVNFELD